MARTISLPTGAHYAISRLQIKRRFWGWLVAFRQRGKHYYKSFYDVRRGGPEKSLAAAIAWRDEQLAKVAALDMREFRRLRHTNNSSSEPGVQFIRPRNQPEGSWQARLKRPDGRELTKAFSVKKYGEREAFRLAVDARNSLLDTVEDRPFVVHPLAKAFCARQATNDRSERLPLAACQPRAESNSPCTGTPARQPQSEL